MRLQLRWFTILVLLVLLSLACSMDLGGPEKPAEVIPVSTEAVERLKTSWKDAFAQAAQNNGQITLVFSEEQITSLVAFKLQAQSDPVFTNPQIYLRDGKIQAYGTVTTERFSGTVRVVMTAEVTGDGKPLVKVESADFGPLPVPTEMLEGVSATVDEMLTGKFGTTATGFRLTSIAIADGLMVVMGAVR